jgi:hypothetical protein
MAIQKTFNLSLDIRKLNPKTAFEVVTNDIDGNKVNITLIDNGSPFDITGATLATLTVLKPDGTYHVSNATISSATGGQLTIILADEAIDVSGQCQATIEVYKNTQRITSARFYYTAIAGLADEADPSGDSSYPVLLDLINTITGAVEAEEGRVSAESSRVSAESSRVSAESSRVSAESGRVNAESSRVSAESSRASAEATRASNETLRETLIDNTRAIDEYSASTQYYKNNIVTKSGASFMAKQNTLGNAPPSFPTMSNDYWLCVAAKGIDGTGAGDMVKTYYDPRNIEADAFSMDNMTEGTDTKILTSTERTSIANTASGLSNHLADYEYQTPTINTRQIQITKASGTDRLMFRLGSDLTGGAITISLDSGATSLPLKDLNGDAVTSLLKGFVEVVDEGTFFTYAPRGGAVHGHQEYTTPGTYSFTIPVNVKQITVLLQGGGGGGGGCGYGGSGGGGGGSGTYEEIISVTPGTSHTVVVGAKGTGGTGNISGTSTNGTTGGNSSFDTYTANGGGGGNCGGATSNTPGSGGTGGTGGGYGGAGGNGAKGFPVSSPYADASGGIAGISMGDTYGKGGVGGFMTTSGLAANGYGGTDGRVLIIW